MAKLVFGMNQSLDGYVNHVAFAPSPTLFRHFIEEQRAQLRTACITTSGGLAWAASSSQRSFMSAM